MHKCFKCGTEFDGNFCPECGEKFAEEKTCPKCGATFSGSAKFCPECGFSFYEKPAPAPTPAPVPSPKPAPATRKPETGKPVTAGAKKLYAAVSALPAVLLGLVSVLLFLFFLAPVAVMPGGELLGEKIPSTSFGNVYESSDYVDMSFTSSMTALIVFAAFALFVVFLIAVSRVFSKLHYKRVTLAGKQIFLRNILTAIGYVLFFVLFLISCILLGQIANEDGGLGLMTAGAAPALVLVFTLISSLAALVCAFAGAHLRKTYPALVKAQEEKIAAAKPTAAETWMKQHKALMIVLTVLLIIALVVGIAVPVGLANRHNGTYFAYNGETGEYHKEQYYKLSGGSWEDESGTKGKISFDGENVTLTYDPTGGMDKTGSSSITIEGTIDGDVLKVGGTIYAKAGHTHKFGEWEVIDAGTCIKKATEAQICACGKGETRETDQYGDHEYVNDKEATCAEYGVDGKFCSLCGKLTSSAKVISALHVQYGWDQDNQCYYVYDLSNNCDHQEIVLPQYNLHTGGKLYPIKGISVAAFRNCGSLERITIPDGVTSIGERAFEGCSGLASIDIPDSVIEIGTSAFDGTAYYNNAMNWDASGVLYLVNHLIKAKETVSGAYTVRAGTKTIVKEAFEFCSGLTSIVIPDSVTTIGDGAFSGCSGLESITVGADNSEYSSQDGILYNKAKTEFVHIPNALKGAVTIPNGITAIESSAFYKRDGLTSITIPDGVTKIGDRAFSDCSGLESITVGAGNPGYSSQDGILYNKAKTEFMHIPIALKGAVTIPNGITAIKSSAFSDCSGLTGISIPDSVTTIGSSAFSGCSGLLGINIPASVTEIGSNAFKDCSGIKTIEIPAAVTTVGDSAFYGCSGLTSVAWNAENCAEAGSTRDPIFGNCANLETVTFGEKVKIISAYVFYGCSKVTSIIIPANVTEIGNLAFSNCRGLENVAIGNAVTTIGNYAFYNCSELKTVTIGSAVTSIGQSAFEDCSRLTEINIPDNVVSIGSAAFYNCTALWTITIGNGVTSIGSAAFKGTAYYRGVPHWDASGVLYIGDYLIAAEDTISGTYTVQSGTKVIADYAFRRCHQLTGIVIPDSVVYIGDSAFDNCNTMSSVTIGENMNSIGDSAFLDCSRLCAFQFSGTVKEWQAIEKGIDWDKDTDDYTVTCTDGRIASDGTVTMN